LAGQNVQRERIKKICFTLVMLLFTVIVCLALLELGVRAFFGGPKYLCTLYAKDDLLGYKLKPHAQMVIDFSYFRQNVSLNSMGLRDREYGPKSQGETRILALGDSFLFGAVWDANQTFVKVLERELNKRSAKQYSVINSGVSGYGSYEEAKFYVRDSPALSPDIILYFFYVNDIESDIGAPQSTVLDNGCAVSKASLELPLFSWARFENWLIFNSRAYIYFRFIVLNENAGLRNILYKVRNTLVDLKLAEPGRLQYKILQTEYDHDTSEGWNATLANVQEMADMAKQRKQKYAIVMIPMKFQVHDDLWEDYKARNRVPGDKYDFGKPARILAETAKKHNAAFIDLTPLLKDAIREKNITDKLYYEGDAHFNVLGNEVAGQALYKELVRQGMVNP
jgi:lysophospholipase L1-like esterase